MITDGTTPLAVLALLGLGGITLLLGAALVVALVRGNVHLTRIVAGMLVAGWGVYAGLLTAAAVASHERLLGRGEEKHICELDCHIAYSVLDVRTVDSAGLRIAVVTLRVRFDSATISARRGMAPLTPGPRLIEVIAQDGRWFAPLADPAVPPLTRPLVPGEWYTTTLTFDLPADARTPHLFITGAAGWPDRLVIGSENSFGHAKTTFALGFDG
jgi:hypothetical protein